MNRISVAITCYKYADFLKDSIGSALDQVVPAHEVLVINDGSPDNTDEAVKPFLDKIRYIKQSNRGLPSARNTSLLNCTGDFILPLDADDRISPFYIEAIQKVINENPDVDVVYCDMTHYGDRSDNVILSSELSDDVFRSFNPLAYCSAIRVSALKEIGGWNVKYVHGWEDYELWVELWERGKKFIRIPEIHFYYNRHGESMIDTSYKPEAVEYSMGLMKRYHPGIFGSL